MSDLLIEAKEIGNHRIKIYYDSCADCPCTSWDLACLYLFEYNDRWHHQLHSECNWKDVFGKYSDGKHTLDDALKVLVQENCDFDLLWNYVKDGKIDCVKLEYNHSDRQWELKEFGHLGWGDKSRWIVVNKIEPHERKDKEWYVFEPMFNSLETSDFIAILNDCGKDIFVKEWSTRGYSQGDYVSGIAFCTKERYAEMCNEDTTEWKGELDEIVDDEVKSIGMWMWGDVKGYVLEKKVEFTKHFKDGREPEEDFEWGKVFSCSGYFMRTEELIEEVISEHNLKEEL